MPPADHPATPTPASPERRAAFGLSVARRWAPPGPRSRPRPAALGSVAAAAGRFSAGLGRAPQIRRQLAGPVIRAAKSPGPVRPPLWWRQPCALRTGWGGRRPAVVGPRSAAATGRAAGPVAGRSSAGVGQAAMTGKTIPVRRVPDVQFSGSMKGAATKLVPPRSGSGGPHSGAGSGGPGANGSAAASRRASGSNGMAVPRGAVGPPGPRPGDGGSQFFAARAVPRTTAGSPPNAGLGCPPGGRFPDRDGQRGRSRSRSQIRGRPSRAVDRIGGSSCWIWIQWLRDGGIGRVDGNHRPARASAGLTATSRDQALPGADRTIRGSPAFSTASGSGRGTPTGAAQLSSSRPQESRPTTRSPGTHGTARSGSLGIAFRGRPRPLSINPGHPRTNRHRAHRQRFLAGSTRPAPPIPPRRRSASAEPATRSPTSRPLPPPGARDFPTSTRQRHHHQSAGLGSDGDPLLRRTTTAAGDPRGSRAVAPLESRSQITSFRSTDDNASRGSVSDLHMGADGDRGGTSDAAFDLRSAESRSSGSGFAGGLWDAATMRPGAAQSLQLPRAVAGLPWRGVHSDWAAPAQSRSARAGPSARPRQRSSRRGNCERADAHR